MIFFKDTYATVWKAEENGKVVKGRISTSEKDNRNEGKYINSNWFATFVGKAKDKALSVSERDKIKILSGKITNITSGEGDNKKSYLNVTIFDFDNITNPSSGGFDNQDSDGFYPINQDELPF